mgnify:CR=1 FL=1
MKPILVCLNNEEKDEPIMKTTREERIKEFETMLRKAPEIMSPLKVAKFSPFGKNRVYEMIKTKELKAYKYQNTYIIAKIDLVEYLADHCEDGSLRHFTIKDGDK